MNPFLLAVIIVVNAAIFTYFDAARLRDSHHIGVGPRGIAPHAWASLVLLFLPLALPYYLSIRGSATSAATREGPPPRFSARDLNVWGYVSSVAFLAAAVYLGLVGQFSWAAMAALGMVAGLFGGRKAVQVDKSGRDFDLGAAAWDMSAFRPVADEDEDDDQNQLVSSGTGAYIPPVAGPGGRVQPGVATSGRAAGGATDGGAGLDIFAPPRSSSQGPSQPTPAPTPPPPSGAPRPMVADAAPPLAMSASEDDEDVWDPLRADEEAQRARESQPAEPPTPPAAPQPSSSEPLFPTPSPAQTQPLSALPVPPTPPEQPPTPSRPSVTLGEELPPGLVDDEEPSLLIDDDLAPFELAPDAPEEEDLPVEQVDDGDDEDLDLLAPLPPVATPGRRRPPRSAPAAPSSSSMPAGGSTPQAMPPSSRTAPAPSRNLDAPRRPSPPPVGGYVGQAKSSGVPPVLIWFAVIAAILAGALWIGSREDGEAADPIAEADVESSDVESSEEAGDDAEPNPTVSRAAAAEEAMRRQMNAWISTYDTVMQPIAELVEQIDFSELQQGSCLELQRQAEKANRQLKVAPDEEVELLLRPAFEAFLEAGRACSSGNEVDWSVHLLQAKDHTHETQILLDERYRYVGPFELEQEEALGHQRSLETISGRYLAGQLEAQQSDE